MHKHFAPWPGTGFSGHFHIWHDPALCGLGEGCKQLMGAWLLFLQVYLTNREPRVIWQGKVGLIERRGLWQSYLQSRTVHGKPVSKHLYKQIPVECERFHQKSNTKEGPNVLPRNLDLWNDRWQHTYQCFLYCCTAQYQTCNLHVWWGSSCACLVGFNIKFALWYMGRRTTTVFHSSSWDTNIRSAWNTEFIKPWQFPNLGWEIIIPFLSRFFLMQEWSCSFIDLLYGERRSRLVWHNFLDCDYYLFYILLMSFQFAVTPCVCLNCR